MSVHRFTFANSERAFSWSRKRQTASSVNRSGSAGLQSYRHRDHLLILPKHLFEALYEVMLLAETSHGLRRRTLKLDRTDASEAQ